MSEEINTTYFTTCILPDFCKDTVDLCNKLEEPYVRGNERKARKKVWESYLLKEKLGKRGIIVYGVRKYPLKKKDRRREKPAKFSPFTEALLANKIAIAFKDGKIVDGKFEIKFSDCYSDLGFCNTRFLKKDFSDIDQSVEDYFITRKGCSGYVSRMKEKLRFNYNVKQAVKKLNNFEGLRSETMQWTSQRIKSSSKSYIIEENPATEEEIALYKVCISKALEELELTSIYEAYKKGHSDKLYKLAKDIFKEETGKSICSKSIVHIDKELMKDGRYLLDEVVERKTRAAVNKSILDKIYSNNSRDRKIYIFEKNKKCTRVKTHRFSQCICEVCLPLDIDKILAEEAIKNELALAEYLLNIDEDFFDRLIAVDEVAEAA